MKPKKLTLSAWGPYPDKECVDFDSLSEGGLFLLTGPTGSGKTMIFDGISYALFGALSGKIRERDTLRSDFAKESQETFAELVFEHRKKVYTILRCPRYSRKKKRGEGEILSQEKACLYMPDGRVIESLTAVNQKIVEILGVNHEQFKQIAMIAQGEFQELLIADSKKRAEIFRNLFGTQADNKLQQLLTERVRALLEKIKDVQSRTDEAVGGIVCGEHRPLEALLAQETLNESQIIEALNSAVKADEKTQNKTELALKALEEGYQSVMADYRLYCSAKQEKDRTFEEIQKLAERTERQEADFCRLKADYDKLPEDENSLKKLREKAQTLKQLIKLIDEASVLEASVREKEARLQKLQLKKEQEKAAFDEQKAVFEKNKEALERQPETERAFSERTIKLRENEQKMKDCRALIGECRAFVSTKKKYREKTAVYKKQQEAADLKKQQFEAADLRKRQCAAGLLAAELAEGRPCPVCGSISHPSPAVLIKAVVSDEQLKAMKEESEAAQLKARSMLGELSAVHQEKLLHWQRICGQCGDVLGLEPSKPPVGENGAFESEQLFYEAIQEKKEQLEAQSEALVKELKALQQRRDFFEQLGKRQKQSELQLKQREALLEQTVKEQGQAENEAGQARAVLENMRAQLPDKDVCEKAYEKKAAIEKEEIRLTAKLKQTREDFQRAGVALAGSKGLLEKSQDIYKSLTQQEQALAASLKSKLISFEAADGEEAGTYVKETAYAKETADVKNIELHQEAVGAWLEAKEQSLREKKAQRDKLYHRILQNRRVLSSMKEKAKEKEQLKKAYSLVKGLENAARGNNPRRLEFEQYVLGAYFDEILEAANVRLTHMSEGRYELFRTEKVKDMRRLNSLDIEVLDNYTGRRRPVKTLSGGESFKAALSLALGLSDVIQSYVGGIDIDLLFIDEGFGSLDEASVQTAVDTLIELSGGSRTVGIISHVSELKERIDTQIVIEKGVYGSKILKQGTAELS